MLTGKQLIDNQSIGLGQETFHALNPNTNTIIEPPIHEATIAEINTAINLAAEAFTTFQHATNKQRAQLLQTIAANLENNATAIVDRGMQETALPEGRLKGELGRTCNQLRLFATFIEEGSWVNAIIDHGNPNRQPAPKPDIRQMQIPLGPVGIFGASNFPLAFSVAGGDTASALAAGCPIIVKGHPAHPGTSELVGQAIQSAVSKLGLPAGVFAMVQGTSHEVGRTIVKHPSIKAVGFTGSLRGGKALFDAANQRPIPIPVYAEMGSTNPLFILPEALAQKQAQIANGLIRSVTLGVGQFCTNPGLVLGLHSEDFLNLKKALKEGFAQTGGGTMLTAGIQKNYHSGITEMATKAMPLGSGTLEGTPNYAQPRIFAATAQQLLDHPDLADEVFGPSTLIIEATNSNQLYQAASNLSGHLTATIHGTDNDLQQHEELIHILREKVGRLIINGFPTGVEVGHAMIHGGPYPATTNDRTTSVGTQAIYRFTRPICYQDFPDYLLPDALKNSNPMGIQRVENP